MATHVGDDAAAASADAANMASLVTVVITTSPTPSAPSTDLLSAVLASFRAHCPGLLGCPVTVVFDTYDHVLPRARLKKGCVTEEEAQCYAAYKDNVRQLVRETWRGSSTSLASKEEEQDKTTTTTTTGLAEYGSPFIADNAVPFTITRTADGRIAFIEPEARLGFGLAVRTALRAITTPYVWIQQHDWTLAADIPLAAMLDVMLASEASMAREAAKTREREEARKAQKDDDRDEGGNAGEKEAWSDDDAGATETKEATSPKGEWWQQTAAEDGDEAKSTMSGTEGGDGQEEEEEEGEEEEPAPVRYICLPSIRMLRYAGSAHVVQFAALRALTAKLKRDFPVHAKTPESSESPESPPPLGSVLPLTPLFFWHDKTHLASTSHYLERVFPSRLAVGRGDFIEDHVGQRARTQMKQDPRQWRKWAMWLYYPDDGNLLCLRHLQGRTWRGEDKEREMRDMYRARNRSAASAAAEAAKKAAATATGAEADAEAEAEAEAEATASTSTGWDGAPFPSAVCRDEAVEL